MHKKMPKFHDAHLGCVAVLQSAHVLFPGSASNFLRICLFFAEVSRSIGQLAFFVFVR